MDEYLFITMAKLKADRRRLEQEQRGRTHWRDSEERSLKSQRSLSPAADFVPLPNWREQS